MCYNNFSVNIPLIGYAVIANTDFVNTLCFLVCIFCVVQKVSNPCVNQIARKGCNMNLIYSGFLDFLEICRIILNASEGIGHENVLLRLPFVLS